MQVVADDPEGVVGHDEWPVLGSASKRDEAATAKAGKFGKDQEKGYRAMILGKYEGRGAVCYCDGSVTPHLTEEVTRQASVGQRVDMTGHDICTDRLRRRQQPSISHVAPRLRGRQW